MITQATAFDINDVLLIGFGLVFGLVFGWLAAKALT